MANLNIQSLSQNIVKTVEKNAPAILVGLGVTTMVGTVVLAVSATPKAVSIIQAKEEELKRELEPKEVVLNTYKEYIPAAVMGVLSITCFITAQTVSIRRQAALLALYSITEDKLTEYSKTVVENIGLRKEQKIRDDVDEKIIKDNPTGNSTIVITGHGNVLCYDVQSGRYFRSNMDAIRAAELDINKELYETMYVTLNSLYAKLDLSDIPMGNIVGWDVNSRGVLDIRYSTQLSDTNEPCIVLNYQTEPIAG